MTVVLLKLVNALTQIWSMEESLSIHTEMVVPSMLTILVGVEIMMMTTSCHWRCVVPVEAAKQ